MRHLPRPSMLAALAVVLSMWGGLSVAAWQSRTLAEAERAEARGLAASLAGNLARSPESAPTLTLDTLAWSAAVTGANGRLLASAGTTAVPPDAVSRPLPPSVAPWTVWVAPRAGWRGPGPGGVAIAVSIAVAALLGGLVWWIATLLEGWRRAAAEHVAELTHGTAAHEEDLRRLDLALQAARMGIWEWTQRTDRVRWSPEVGPMFGRPEQPAEMPLALFLALVHPDDREELEFRILTAGREQGRLAATVRTVNGQRWLRLDGAAVAPQAGPVRVVAMMADVTERVQLEEHVQQAAKLDALGAMAAGIAHDFNNMLTAIGGSAELARQEVEDVPDPSLRASLAEDLDGVLRATAQARMLTSQLMTYSRREQSQPRTVGLDGVVRELEPMLRRLLGVRVRLDVALADDAAGVVVLADPRQLQQVVMNLVINARDAMPNGGRVTVAVRKAADRAILTVTDTGPGIPAEVLPRLFEAFFTTKAAGKGTGLGLATVHRIVVGAGGEVTAGNVPEGGACFTVRLPLQERARLSEAS